MLRYVIPLLIFVVLALFLALGLKLNPRDIPSPLIDKPAPAFSLPILSEPQRQLSERDFVGQVWLLNVWASWCVSCRSEHPVLIQLAKLNVVPIVGLNYKDEPADARQWLVQLGNPYQFSIMDIEGRTGIDYGVYGVPETFVIDKHGIIRYKHTGPVTTRDVEKLLLPMIERLKTEN